MDTDAHSRWEAGLPDEIEFWRQILNGTLPNADWVAGVRGRVAGQTPFPVDLIPHLKSGSITRILDVGSGPVTTICPTAPSAIEVIATDPLADVYNKLLDENELRPSTRALRVDGEHLSEFGLGLFDIVYSCNALDHTYDPVRVIREMVTVCNQDGVVFFVGHVNESVTQNGQGLHQWNFMPLDNGDLVIWQAHKLAVSLRCALGETVNVKASGDVLYRVEIKHKTILSETPRVAWAGACGR